MGRRARRHRGFSLLEVILALAILCGTLAVLGEVVRAAMRNAEIARDLTRAQLLCESKMAEITAGITPAEPIEGAAFELEGQLDDPGIPWLYSIRREHTDEEGLVVIRVMVTQDLPLKQRPVTFSLDRWILDDGIEMSEQPTAGEPGSESLDSGGSR